MPCETLACEGESNPTTGSSQDNSNQIVGDSLASGVAIMLAMTVIQRLVGLGRNILICWFLEPEDLGVWNLANSFLILVAPLVLFGVPATLVRYVEHYRQKGQLRSYLKRVFTTSALLTTVGVALILLNHKQVSWLAFGETPDSSVLLVTTISLVIVIAFNLLVELLTALRQLKSLALVQFWNSLLFAGLSIGLLAGTKLGPMAVIVAFAGANLVTAGYSLWIARRTLSKIQDFHSPAPLTQFWQRMGPFVFWFWLNDLLMNLFETVDRYMIIHVSGLNSNEAVALVGQYHSSRIIGVLMIAVIGMLRGTLLSYLSHDWESGNHRGAAKRLDYALRLVGILMTGAAGAILVLAPAIYDWALKGRYTDGFSVLPLTMAYCIWFGLLAMAVNYVWCAERPRAAMAAIALSLFLNAALNYVLIPSWGLTGAVWGTAVANLCALFGIYWVCSQLGMQYRWGTMVTSLAPFSLLLGGWPAIAFCIAIMWHGAERGWLFDDQERTDLHVRIQGILQKLPRGLSKPLAPQSVH